MGIKTSMASKAVPYIPSYQGNRDEENPTIVYIKPISTKDYRQLLMNKSSMNVSVAQGGDYSLDNINPQVWVEATEEVLTVCVEKVLNFEIEDLFTGTGEMVTEPEFFLGSIPDGLKEELFKACIDIAALKEGLKKT